MVRAKYFEDCERAFSSICTSRSLAERRWPPAHGTRTDRSGTFLDPPTTGCGRPRCRPRAEPTLASHKLSRPGALCKFEMHPFVFDAEHPPTISAGPLEAAGD